VAGAAVLFLAPVLLAIGVLVRCTSRGPALFRQERVGLGKQPFTMLKFRTMRHDCDDAVHRAYVTDMLTRADDARANGVAVYKLADDPRITPLGRTLRRASLDELPQLINVLRGEMSLVGPRPMLDWEVELLEARYDDRFAVKPGITGWWQVQERNNVTMRDAIELDLAYVQRRSLFLDLRILATTIPAVARSAMTGRGVG
jgi:lipopolysaccharide/colanic/teichoic acid biosynthesis glycosyltransferase